MQDINEDETRLEELKKVYNDIVDRLDKLLEYGQLKEFSRFAIIKITQTVVHNIWGLETEISRLKAEKVSGNL